MCVGGGLGGRGWGWEGALGADASSMRGIRLLEHRQLTEVGNLAGRACLADSVFAVMDG